MPAITGGGKRRIFTGGEGCLPTPVQRAALVSFAQLPLTAVWIRHFD